MREPTEHAMEVVEILRRDVKKPSTKSYMRYRRFLRSGRRFGCRGYVSCCPMGLHRCAKNPTPLGSNFPAAPYRAVAEFADWWDRLEWRNHVAAIDLIWPPPSQKRRQA